MFGQRRCGHSHAYVTTIDPDESSNEQRHHEPHLYRRLSRLAEVTMRPALLATMCAVVLAGFAWALPKTAGEFPKPMSRRRNWHARSWNELVRLIRCSAKLPDTHWITVFT